MPRTSQISLYPTRENAFAVFSCGSSNVNVLGREIIMERKGKTREITMEELISLINGAKENFVIEVRRREEDKNAEEAV